MKVASKSRNGIVKGSTGNVSGAYAPPLRASHHQHRHLGRQPRLPLMDSARPARGRRLVALTPPAKVHLTSFHGVYAPLATLRPLITGRNSPCQTEEGPAKKPKRPRIDWATLHQHTFGTDVLRCPCGGRRLVRAVFSTLFGCRRETCGIGLSAAQPTPADVTIAATTCLRCVSRPCLGNPPGRARRGRPLFVGPQ